jgi:hypothetical protein
MLRIYWYAKMKAREEEGEETFTTRWLTPPTSTLYPPPISFFSLHSYPYVQIKVVGWVVCLCTVTKAFLGLQL